jgi:hypothetical protein
MNTEVPSRKHARWQKFIDVWEKCTDSIFRVEE